MYHRRMSEMLEDIIGAEVIVDDILVWGTTVEEHDKRVKFVLPYKFYVLGQVGLSKQCRPRSDCF